VRYARELAPPADSSGRPWREAGAAKLWPLLAEVGRLATRVSPVRTHKSNQRPRALFSRRRTQSRSTGQARLNWIETSTNIERQFALRARPVTSSVSFLSEWTGNTTHTRAAHLHKCARLACRPYWLGPEMSRPAGSQPIDASTRASRPSGSKWVRPLQRLRLPRPRTRIRGRCAHFFVPSRLARRKGRAASHFSVTFVSRQRRTPARPAPA
jgi:hypothetical protein